jgi:glycolate oxidase FAD binding subunit
VAELLSAGGTVRPVGGRTKTDWGGVGPAAEVELSTRRLGHLVAHNEGDLTAVLEAGVRLADAQTAFADRGQRLSLDPPNPGGEATIGGVVATADSGPLRHRHGAVRDLILGVRIALPDGTVARAGSNVIKNVAGYDLAKLMCGALGTLGVVTEVTVRLHPLPAHTVTVAARGGDLGTLSQAAAALARLPLQLEALDLRWDGPAAGGALLARSAGSAPAEVAGTAATVAAAHGLEVTVTEDDDDTWAEQRSRQRASDGEAVLRVSALPTALAAVLGAAPSGVARAGLGLAWLRIPADAMLVRTLRGQLAPATCVLLDAPAELRAAVDPWGVDGPAVALARRVKQRFDPGGVCNPGIHVGGI